MVGRKGARRLLPPAACRCRFPRDKNESSTRLPASVGVSPSCWGVTLVVVLTTLITASHLDEIAPTIARILRVLAYGATLLIIAWLAWPIRRSPRTAMRTYIQAYRRTILWPLVLQQILRRVEGWRPSPDSGEVPTLLSPGEARKPMPLEDGHTGWRGPDTGAPWTTKPTCGGSVCKP